VQFSQNSSALDYYLFFTDEGTERGSEKLLTPCVKSVAGKAGHKPSVPNSKAVFLLYYILLPHQKK
jgi:hypothetical protein